MACQAIRSWTVSKLIGAFIDLSIAYVLLCCSTVAFFISNFLGIFGFSLPCTCNGVFGKPNPDHCLQKLLVESPTDKISAVQLSVRSRFPFDSVWGRNEDCQLSFKVVKEKKLDSGVIELEGEASCSSVSAPSNVDLIATTEEGKFDVKGKGIARTRKQKGLLRRRRKLSSNSSYENVRCGAPVVPLSNYGNSNTGEVYSENSTPVDSHDLVEPSHVLELDHRSWLSSESNSAIDANKFADNDIVSLGREINDTREHSEHDGHQENAIRILEQALKEERAARSALFSDLEKERTAAATAADEAMAMILRLQEEKAAIELEARQYERILEEKSTYDAEEMDILKEIIVRREMEKHFLEKEVESYKKMLEENEQFEEDPSLIPGEDETTIDYTDYTSVSVANVLPLIQCGDIPETVEQVDDSTVDFSQEFREKGLVSGASSEGQLSMSHDHGYEEKSVVLVGEVKNDTETESIEQYDVKGSDVNLDVKDELLYDIHVIDDKCVSQDNDNAESSMCTPEDSSTLPPLSSSAYEDKISELRRHSIATVDHERERLNNEVGYLRERLRSIQTGREKLNFSLEHRDKGETELMLLDDIASLLQEIRQLTEPQKTMRRTSLPPPGSKDTSSKRRRCRSASVELSQSS